MPDQKITSLFDETEATVKRPLSAEEQKRQSAFLLEQRGIRPEQGVTQVEDLAAKDGLGRTKITAALATLLQSRQDTRRPMAIGLFGHWGSGKSSQIKFLKDALKGDGKGNICFVEFNAWEHEKADNLAAALAQTITDGLLKEVRLLQQLRLAFRMTVLRRSRLSKAAMEELSNSMQTARTWSYGIGPAIFASMMYMFLCTLLFFTFLPKSWLDSTLAWSASLLGATGLAIIGVYQFVLKNLSGWFEKLTVKDQIKRFSLPDFKDRLGTLYEIKHTLGNLCALRLGDSSVALDKFDTLLLVVDDLDRCSPQAVKQVLDAIRLVANVDRVVTLVAIDDRIAFAAVEKHYDQFGATGREPAQVARDYLAKVFQVSITLSPVSEDVAKAYISEDLFFDELKNDLARTKLDDEPEPVAPVEVQASTAFHQYVLPRVLLDEVALFAALAVELGIVNPRELWRLKQSWLLVRAMNVEPGAGMEELEPLLRTLFMREWLLQLPAKKRADLQATAANGEAYDADLAGERFIKWARRTKPDYSLVDLVLLPSATPAA